jgi:excisionase family DNA binding protein
MRAPNSQLAYDIAEVCELTKCSRAYLYEQINEGTLRAVKRGRRTLILKNDLESWLKGFPAIEPKTAA